MSLLALIMSVCGCKSPPKEETRPPVPGVNRELHYPVLVFGGSSHRIDIVNSADDLTTTSNMRGSVTEYEGTQILDADHNLYNVEGVRIASKVKTWPTDATGSSPHRVELRLSNGRQATLEETKRLLIDVVRNPASLWSGLNGGKAARNGVERLERAPTFAALIDECSNKYSW